MRGVFNLNVLSKGNLYGKHLLKSAAALTVALLILTTCNTQVFAGAYEPEININLQIGASWGGGDILNLDITDLDTMERQQIAIRLSDFIGEGENAQYILLQAMDLLGERQSGVIQIENPLFDPNRPQPGQTVGDSGSSVSADELPEDLQNIIAEVNQPDPPPTLTPDGTGSVVDNIMTVNDIEFFTVTTDSGSDFFLVVDRQRTSNNVYLLNTVTEADLMALAEARGETSQGGITAQPTDSAPALTMEEIMQAVQDAMEQNQEQTPPAAIPQNNNNGIVIMAAVLLVIVGGAFLVWKVLWPKLQNAAQSNQDDVEEEDYDNEDEEVDEDYTADYEAVEANEDESYSHEVVQADDDSLDEDFESAQGGEDDEE